MDSDNFSDFTAVIKELPRTKSDETMMVLCVKILVWLVHASFNVHLHLNCKNNYILFTKRTFALIFKCIDGHLLHSNMIYLQWLWNRLHKAYGCKSQSWIRSLNESAVFKSQKVSLFNHFLLCSWLVVWIQSYRNSGLFILVAVAVMLSLVRDVSF